VIFIEFLEKKIKIRWVLLFILILVPSIIYLTYLVRDFYTHNRNLSKKLTNVEIFIDLITSIPKELINFYNGKHTSKALIVSKKFSKRINASGFIYNYSINDSLNLGYLLLNRYDGDLRMSVSELVDLKNQKILHLWTYDVDNVWKLSKLNSHLVDFKKASHTERARNFHTFIDNSGNIYSIFGKSPLIKNDFCSNLSIVNDDKIYHHSIEIDHEGNFWIPSYIEPKSVELGSDKFHDDGIVKLSKDGEILFEKSVIKILSDNGFGHLVYGTTFTDDPIHLNDIQPVMKTSQFWKKGDIFLSLRNQSIVFLYRPSSNKIIWLKQGPWHHQHDINILDDYRISIFDNNDKLSTRRMIWGFVDGHNDTVIFNFKDNTLIRPFSSTFEKLDIRTITEGRSKLINDDILFVEETNSGRLFIFDKHGKVLLEYINRANDNNIYQLNWSRIISKEKGDLILKKINLVCDS